jgi:hypothetical protein
MTSPDGFRRLRLNPRGVIVQSVVLSIGAAGLLFQFVSRLNDGASRGVLALSLVACSVFCLLAARSPFTSVIVSQEVLVLVSPLWTRHLEWGRIHRIETSSWFGGPANFVRMKNGRRYLIPLATQVQRYPALQSAKDEIYRVACFNEQVTN